MKTLTMFKNKRRQWTWNIKSGNGKKIATAGEGVGSRKRLLTQLRGLFPAFFVGSAANRFKMVAGLLLMFAGLCLVNEAFAQDPAPVQRPQPVGYNYSPSTKTITIAWYDYVKYVEALVRVRDAEIARLKAAPATTVDLLPVIAKLDLLLARPTGVAISVTLSTTGGNRVTFTASAEGTQPFNYQWRLNGVPIAGATAATLVIENATAANNGNYSCSVSNSIGSASGSVELKL